MDVAFFGQGSVADRCRELLGQSGLSVVAPEKADLWLSVHCKEIFKTVPKGGILNLHNSYLPWNRGAHPCTWAIIDKTPHGATMHWVDQGVDTGPILYQEAIEIRPDDTAHTLYQRTAELEVQVFRECLIMLSSGLRLKQPQEKGGSYHSVADFDRLARAMTTSDCKVVREA